MKRFEQACVLPTDCWPGPAPNGQQKWQLRWGGGQQGSYSTKHGSADHQTECIFEKEDDGTRTLRFSAVMFYEGQHMLINARKVKDAPRQGAMTQHPLVYWHNCAQDDSCQAGRLLGILALHLVKSVNIGLELSKLGVTCSDSEASVCNAEPKRASL